MRGLGEKWKMNDWDLIGKVWVDSGQIAIADPCFLLSNKEYLDTFVNKPQEVQPHKFKRGVVASGWGGDGDFPVYVKKNKAGLILEMKIILDRNNPLYGVDLIEE